MKSLQEIETLLREQKPILRERYKVKDIGIFGSFVRGEQREASDLDLLIEFEEPIGLIKYVGLQNYLTRMVGERVDLVMKSALGPRIGARILEEVVYV
jgi:predicted nucleotidyltransferase